MRELGLSATSAGAIRIVRRHATQLGLDASQFRGRRTWSDADLRNAVVTSRSWDEVLATLGLSTASGNARTHVKGHAIRLGIDFRHLGSREVLPRAPLRIAPDLAHLRKAGPSIAAAWFAMRGGWQVGIGRHPHSLEKGGPRLPYDPDTIDYFFIVDGDLTMHLIPSRVVAGRVGLGLRTYQQYIVGSAAGLLEAVAQAGVMRESA